MSTYDYSYLFVCVLMVTALLLNFGLSTKLWNQMRRNIIAKLVQDGKMAALGIGCVFCFHPAEVADSTTQPKHFF